MATTQTLYDRQILDFERPIIELERKIDELEKELARNAVCPRERLDKLVARLLDAGGQSRVKLDAVARVEHGVLEHRRAALCAKAESADALAQLNRSSAMTEPETDEAVHGGRDPTPHRDRE